MNLSPAFHHLRAAYQAEMDDLSFDSEGRDVLRQRLADKRRSVEVLCQMTEVAPEMVAVVFHQAFHFKAPAVMQQIVGGELDECPPWDEIASAIELAPWAQPLLDTFLRQADGQQFMTVAAALVYLHDTPDARLQAAEHGDEDDQQDGDDDDRDDRQDAGDDASDDPRSREEAAADWLADQGFDRKD
jgi:hypothetical protein